MTAETIHTCSYECERPECIRAQRDELASRMTAETSNARGEVVAWQYRRLDPEDGIGPWVGCSESDAEIIRRNTFHEVRPLYAAAPPPAAALGDVRGLVAKLAAHVRPTCSELWDEAQAFLAAEGVQAGEVEQRARELLAQHCECGGGMQYTKTSDALHAIVAALSQQPEARGVVDAPSVDDLSRDAMAALLRSEKVYAKWSDLAADALAVAQSMRTALTGERNG